jgi:hypothetical protein
MHAKGPREGTAGGRCRDRQKVANQNLAEHIYLYEVG